MRIILAFVLVISLANAKEAKEAAFAGIMLEEDLPAQATIKLEKAGFKFVEKEKGINLYQGQFMKHGSTIGVMAHNELVSKVILVIGLNEKERAQYYSALSLYDTVKKALRQKYGKPTTDQKEFEHPYTEGDNYSMLALKANKANIGAGWLEHNVWVQLQYKFVIVHYESETFYQKIKQENKTDADKL